jgi:hypothetical protein
MCMMNSGPTGSDVEVEKFVAGSGKTIKEKEAIFKANKFRSKNMNLRIRPTV